MSGLQRGTTLGVGERRAGRIGLGLLAWVVGLIWIFPVAWTVFTSFKTEQDATAQTLTHATSDATAAALGSLQHAAGALPQITH